MTEKITAQDPHYEEKLAELTDGLDMEKASQDFSDVEDQTASSICLSFEKISIPGNPSTPDLRLEVSMDKSGINEYKLIYHILGASQVAAEAIGKEAQGVCQDILHPLPGDVYAQFSQNPLLRGTWDFIVWGVPALVADDIRRIVTERLVKTFGGE